MKIGLLFGSFNPVHLGHLIIANFFINEAVDQVWFVVSPQNPLKESESLLADAHRLQLVELAIADNENFFASDIEFNLSKPSYTINTLHLLSERYPERKFYLIIGSDNFLQLPLWKSSNEIIQNFNILVYQRPLFPCPSTQQSNIQVFNAPLLDISSTGIRKMIAENKSIRYLVPDAVNDEIKNKGYFQ